MSELRDLHEQINSIENILIKKKLEHLVATKGKNRYDMTFNSNDFEILMDRLEQEGISEGTGYIKYVDEFDFDDFANVVLVKIDGQTFQFCIERGNIFVPFATDNPDTNTDNLIDINLDELLQIDSQTLQDTSISDLYAELIEKRDAFMKLKLAKGIKAIQDGIELADGSELSIHRESDKLTDMLYGAGYRFNTGYIYKKDGIYIRVGDNIIKYDENTRTLSKEISIKDLEEYFKDDDIAKIIEEERATADDHMVETVRSFREKPDKEQLIALPQVDLQQLGISLETIEKQSIGEVIAVAYRDGTDKISETTKGGNEFLEKMLRYATRRCEVRDTNDKAKKLSKEYEAQLPKDPHSLDDNN